MTTIAPMLARWLGADSSVPVNPWENPDVSTLAFRATGVARTAVLTIEGMPRELRPTIETAMAVCVTSESELTALGADPLTANWFTEWRRTFDLIGQPGLECRQALTGSDAEINRLRTVVTRLADDHGFHAELSLAD